MLLRIKLPTEVRELLDRMGGGNSPFPLQAVEGNRFPCVGTFPARAFAHCRMPAEARAGLLLYAGLGSDSHSASQVLKSREGTYWHAIYHRMEPDDWNAKYWFRQVGLHDIGLGLAQAARTAGWEPGNTWDHSHFVDFTTEARASADAAKVEIAQAIQLSEWRLLFEFCAQDKRDKSE